jgi:hypothetical protein
MPYYSRTTVFILTPVIFRYHLPLTNLNLSIHYRYIIATGLHPPPSCLEKSPSHYWHIYQYRCLATFISHIQKTQNPNRIKIRIRKKSRSGIQIDKCRLFGPNAMLLIEPKSYVSMDPGAFCFSTLDWLKYLSILIHTWIRTQCGSGSEVI